MKKYEFEVIPTESDSEHHNHSITISKKPLLRQIMINISVWLVIYFTPGLLLGVPPVFIAQTRREANSTEAVSTEMASWLSSTFAYGDVPWIFVVPTLAHYFGRKIVFFILTLNMLACCILLYCSTSVMHVFLTEIMVGLSLASQTTVSLMIIVEYSSPQYRGVFITIKSAMLYWGIWVGNALGTFSHWRNVGILGLFCSIFGGTVIFWPESPYWLASKRKFDKCAASHRWLKGVDKESEKELKILIESRKDIHRNERFSLQACWRNLRTVIRKKEVYKPLLLSLSLLALYSSTGKLVCTMYILDIIKELTQSDSTAYLAMLILDGVTVLGMYIGCILAKYLRRRTMLLGCSFIGILFLYVTSLYLYLSKLYIVNENRIVLISLLTGFSIFVSVGPMILITAVYAEIMPRKFVHEASFIVGLFDATFATLMLKLAPNTFVILGLHGSFLFYAIISSIIIIILYKYLPETKDKTLEEISDCFKGVKHTPYQIESRALT